MPAEPKGALSRHLVTLLIAAFVCGFVAFRTNGPCVQPRPRGSLNDRPTLRGTPPSLSTNTHGGIRVPRKQDKPSTAEKVSTSAHGGVATWEESPEEAKGTAGDHLHAAHHKVHNLPPNADTIFASIASFRDDECADTIADMFRRAEHREWLFIGAVEQHGTEHSCLPASYKHCDPEHHFCPSDNIRIRKVLPGRSKGPTFGRYVAALLYRGERWFLMIDAHNRFMPKWDSILVDNAHRSGSEKPVLSHYPAALNAHTKEYETPRFVSFMCGGGYMKETGYLRLSGPYRPSGTIRKQPFAAAGFLFARATLLHDVPFDPYLDFLFDGEELLYSARMWTHGYDLFSPDTSVMAHFYERPKAAKVWSENATWYVHQRTSIKRVQHILKIPQNFKPDEPMVSKADIAEHPRIERELDKYGLGTVRSLEEYWAFAKLTPHERGRDERKQESAYCDEHQS